LLFKDTSPGGELPILVAVDRVDGVELFVITAEEGRGDSYSASGSGSGSGSGSKYSKTTGDEFA